MPNFKDRINAKSQEIIDSLADDEDHFSMIAGIIGNLADYLADTVEPR